MGVVRVLRPLPSIAGGRVTPFVTAVAVAQRCCGSASAFNKATISSSSPAAEGDHQRQMHDAAEEGNTFSGPRDAMFASKVAGQLRKQVFQPSFQTTKANVTEKEDRLLRMWREVGNNPELGKDSHSTQQRRTPSLETGAMETQTTSWEGSGAVAAATEALRAQEAEAAAAATAAAGGGEAKKSTCIDEAPVNVAEAYGQSFRDVRPANPNETVEAKRRRLVYQSRYRGMVEMDLILGHFARCRLASLDAELLDEYDILLKQLDNDLFRWVIMDLERPPEIEKMSCFHELKDFVSKERAELLGSL